jgi:hypothetical protein
MCRNKDPATNTIAHHFFDEYWDGGDNASQTEASASCHGEPYVSDMLAAVLMDSGGARSGGVQDTSDTRPSWFLTPWEGTAL